MNTIERIAPYLLLAVFAGLALKGGYDILTDGMTAARAAYTVLDVIIVIALALRTSPVLRGLGLLACALYAALGAIAVMLGLWRLMSADLGGVVLVAIGLLAVALAMWTIVVLRKAAVTGEQAP